MKISKILLIFLYCASINAQYNISPNSSSTAQTFGSFSHDIGAVNLNPAILSYKYKTKKRININDSITKYRLNIIESSTKLESDSLLNLINNFLYKDSLFAELKSIDQKDSHLLILDNIIHQSSAEFYYHLLRDNGYSITSIDSFITNPLSTDNSQYHIYTNDDLDIELINIGAMLSNSSINVGWINKFILNGSKLGNLANKDKKSILEIFPSSGLSINPIINSRTGFRFKNFAFQLAPQIISEFIVPNGLIDMIFMGNKLSNPINLNGKKNQFQIVLPFSISYGSEFKIPPFKKYFKRCYWGINAKYLGGIAYLESTFDTLKITPNIDNISINTDINTKYSLAGAFMEINNEDPFNYNFNTNAISPFPFSGSGIALDLGLIFDINNEVNANISLTNLFGTIYWGNGSPAYKHQLKLNSKLSLDELQNDPKSKIYNGIETDTNTVITKLKTKYPGALILGTNLSKNKFSIASNLKIGFNNQIGNSTKPRLSLGLELKPISFISLLSGLSIGGYESFQWGMGINLKLFFMQINCSYSENGGFPGNAKGVSTSISTSIIF